MGRAEPSPPPESADSTRVSTTKRLLQLYREGDVSALDVLFQREIPLLRRWARGRLPAWARTLVDTADMVQDALARTLPHLQRFEPRREKALQAYLRSAVSNQIKNELRRIRRRPVVTDALDAELTVASPDQSADATLMEQEDEALYARALARLSDSDRSAVVARLQLGYSYEQIALLLEKRSVNAARMAVTRAVARLIDLIAKERDTSQ